MSPPDPWTHGLAWVSFFSAISVGDHKGDPRRRRYPRRLANWCFSQRQEISPSKTGVSSCKKRCKIGISPGFSPIFRRPKLVSMISTIGDQVISPGVSLWISPSQNRDPNVCHLSMILAKKSDDPLRIAWNLALSTPAAPHQKSKGPRFGVAVRRQLVAGVGWGRLGPSRCNFAPSDVNFRGNTVCSEKIKIHGQSIGAATVTQAFPGRGCNFGSN